MTTWVWTGNELRDEFGELIALVRSDVIIVGEQRLLIESTPGTFAFRARATSSTGEVFTAQQSGLTVNKLAAHCGPHSYSLDRVSVWRKERIVTSAHGRVARIKPLISGKVVVLSEECASEMPDLDAVFVSWVCVLVDSPVRRPKY